MSDNNGVRFIRKNGRIIPIKPGAWDHAARTTIVGRKLVHGAVAGTGLALSARDAYRARNKAKIPKNPNVKVNKGWNAAGLGLSIASGALAAATFAKNGNGWGSVIKGAVASHIIDAAGVAANIKSVSGSKASDRDKAEQIAKQEGRNFLIGNGVYAAGMFGLKRNRKAAVDYVKSGYKVSKKVVKAARTLLGMAE